MQRTRADLAEALSETYNRITLGVFPTPVAPLILYDIGAPGEVWVKRDDFSSTLYGGNKTRKLEFLLGQSPKPVLTFGPLGSHHVYATAVHARTLGLRCGAVLVPQHMTDHHEAIFEKIKAICDPLLVLGPHPGDLARSIGAFVESAFTRGVGYQICPPGGTSPVGTLGYVLAALELASQIHADACPMPRNVFVPLATGGTAVGLAVGFALARLPVEVVAVRVVPRVALPRISLSLLARQTVKLVRAAWPKTPERLEIPLKIEDRFSGGYAQPTLAAEEAMVMGENAGLALETTYSAKALAALLASTRATDHREGPALFWQTFAPTKRAEQMAGPGVTPPGADTPPPLTGSGE